MDGRTYSNALCAVDIERADTKRMVQPEQVHAFVVFVLVRTQLEQLDFSEEVSLSRHSIVAFGCSGNA